MLGGLGGFHLCVTQLLAQEHRPYHRFSSLRALLERRWKGCFCTVISLHPPTPVQMGTAALHPQPSSFKQDSCKCTCSTAWVRAHCGSTMAYRVQLLHILPASNAMNLAFHLEELLQRTSWWHSPVSSGEVRGISESEFEGCTCSVLAVSLGSRVWSCHCADNLWDHKVSSHSLSPLIPHRAP